MAEEQVYPSFKSEGAAFDRAKTESEVTSGNTGDLTSQFSDAKIEAGKVSQKAINFYNETYNKEIKSLDPAYNPTGGDSIFYYFAYSNASSDRKNIKKEIEKGETVDGKEIVNMAKESASSKVNNAKKLKTGTVTEIFEKLGADGIKKMDLYNEVKNDFDKKVGSENYNFDKLLSKLSQIVGLINNPAPGVQQGIIYTPENNATISAIAKILKEEGLTNESVSAMSERYRSNLEELIKKIGPGKIEPTTESKKEEVEKSKPVGETSEKKLENKTEAPSKPEEKPQASTAPKETPVESAKAEKTEAAAKTETAATPSAPAVEVSKQEIVKKETSASANTGPEMIKGSQSGSDFLKDIFGGFLGIDSEEEEGEVAEGPKIESLGVELAKSLIGEESNTNDKKNTIEGVSKTAEQEIKKLSGVSSNVEKIQKKVGYTPETSSKLGGIKETTTQKLSSPVKTETPPEKPGQSSSSTGEGSNTSQGKSESKETQRNLTSEENKETEISSTPSSSSQGSNSMEDLSSKMETMIALLAQLNDTLSAPLLVTSTTKKFD